jgi:polyhydroxyalkanoate synthesis regulator phasin
MDDGTAAEQEDDEGLMNSKQGTFGPSVLAGLIVAAGAWGISKVTDHHDETATATAIATLTERVSTLTEQVRRLNEQPYATRQDLNGFASRVDGLAERVSNVERAQQQRR